MEYPKDQCSSFNLFKMVFVALNSNETGKIIIPSSLEDCVTKTSQSEILMSVGMLFDTKLERFNFNRKISQSSQQ